MGLELTHIAAMPIIEVIVGMALMFCFQEREEREKLGTMKSRVVNWILFGSSMLLILDGSMEICHYLGIKPNPFPEGY